MKKNLLLLLCLPLLVLAQNSQTAPRFYPALSSNLSTPETLDLPTTMWIDIADTGWYNANQDIFEINTAEEFAGLAQLVLAGNNFSEKTIQLMNDLDLGAHLWTPVGADVDFPFSGNFDGNHHTITNLKINLPNDSFVGLFGHVVEAKIENVNIDTAEVYGKDTVGSLVANVYTSEVYNCHANNVLIVATDYNIGGLSGSILTGSIMENCSATNVNVTGDSQIGGLLGSVWDASILRKSYSTGEVSGGYIIGGLVGFTTFGFNADVNVVENCYSRTHVSANLGRVGGFYGQVSGALEVSNSYATGTATAPEYAGGFVGIVTNMTSVNNHFDMETSGHMEAVGGWEGAPPMELDITARTSEFMKTAEFVDILNMQVADADVWFMGEEWNDYYPILVGDLGVNEEVIDRNKFVLYPNPVMDRLMIRSNANIASIAVYNAQGQLVLSAKEQNELTVSQLPEGIYFINIYAEGKIWSEKFIKE